MRLASLVTACALALIACGGEPTEERTSPETGTAEPTEADGGAEPGEPGPAAEAVSGQAVYAANCATCHGDTGDGNGPAAVGLEPPPSDLTDAQWASGDGSLSAITNTIENGSPGTAMIAWQGTLTEAEIDAVARYVLSLSGGGAEAETP